MQPNPATATADWTTRKLLAWMTQHFTQQGLESPRVQAEMLLGHVIGCDRLRLYMEPEREASPAERETLRGLVRRAAAHEPVDYLVGRTPFFGLELTVDARVLIPRPSTETLVEHALQHFRRTHPASRPVPRRLVSDDAPQSDAPDAPDAPPESQPHTDAAREAAGSEPFFLDLCTGSGAVAAAVLSQLPGATAIAADLSPEALAVAGTNLERLDLVDRCTLVEGDLYEALPDGTQPLDAVLSNPPYISDAEWEAVPRHVAEHEPTLALRGGADGLDLVRRVVAGAWPRLKAGGLLAVEIAASQAEASLALTQDQAWTRARVLEDHERLPRVLVAVKPD